MAIFNITSPDGKQMQVEGEKEPNEFEVQTLFANKKVMQDAEKFGKGNIDLTARPTVKNADGSISTVKSMSFQPSEGKYAGKEVLIPTISDDGKVLSEEDAINNFYKSGKNLGVFNTPEEATKYAEELHNKQDKMYSKNKTDGVPTGFAASAQRGIVQKFGTAATLAGENFEQGMANVRISDIYFKQVMTGKELSVKDQAEVNKLQAQKPTTNYHKNAATTVVGAFAQQLPVLGRTFTGQVVGAGVGAGVGSVIPVAGTAVGAMTGMRVGAFTASFQQSAGDIMSEISSFRDMEGKQIEMGIRRSASVVGGIVNGSLEFIGWGAISKSLGLDIGAKAINQAVIGIAKDATKSTILKNFTFEALKAMGKEEATELTQEVVSMVLGEVAKNSSKGEFDPMTSENVAKRLAVTAVDTLAATGVLAFGGGGVKAAVDINYLNKTNAQLKADALANNMTIEQYKAQLAADIPKVISADVISKKIAKVAAKQGETKALTFFVDNQVKEIGKELGIPLTVTSRGRQAKGYASEHSLKTGAIAADISMSEHSVENKINITQRLINDATVSFVSTSDPVLLAHFKGNKKLRDFTKIDKTLGKTEGFNHIDHIHVTVNTGKIKSQVASVVTGVPIKEGQASAFDVETQEDMYSVIKDIKQQFSEKIDEAMKPAQKGKEIVVDEDIFQTQKVDDILNEISIKAITAEDKVYTKEDISAAWSTLSVATGKSETWLKRNFNNDKFAQAVTNAKAMDDLEYTGKLGHSDVKALGILKDGDKENNIDSIIQILENKDNIKPKILQDFTIDDREYSLLKNKFEKAKTIQEKGIIFKAFEKWFDSKEIYDEIKISYFRDFVDGLDNVLDPSKTYIVKAASGNVQSAIAGFKQGLKTGIKQTTAEVKAVQNALVDYINKANISKADKANFLTTVKNIRTVAQLEKALPKIEDKLKRIAQAAFKQKVVADIDKMLKTKAVKTQNGIRKGAFNAEETQIYRELQAINDLTQAEAFIKLMEISKTDDMTFSERLIAKMYSYKSNGMKSNIELLKSLRSDLAKFKREAINAKNISDLEKKLDKKEYIDEAINTMSAITSKIGKRSAIKKFYDRHVSTFYNVMQNFFGEKFAEENQTISNEILFKNKVAETMRGFNDDIKILFNIDKKDKFKLADIYKSMNERKSEFVIKAEDEIRPRQLTTFEVMDIYNACKNDETRADYYKHYGEQNIDNLIGKLSTAEQQMADHMALYVGAYADIFNEYSIKKYGVDMGRRANYWMATSEHEKEYNALNPFIPSGNIPSAIKEKQRLVKPIPKSAYIKMQKHIRQAEFINYLADKHEKLSNIFNNKEIRNMFDEIAPLENIGEVAYKAIEKISLNALQEEASIYGQLFEKVMGSLAVQAVSSPRVFFGQLTATINYSMVTPNWGKYFTEGVKNPVNTAKYMMEEIPYIKERFGYGSDQVIMDALKSLGGNRWMATGSRILSLVTRTGDIGSVIYGGYPYYKSLLKTMSKDDAIKKFIIQTETTMQGSSTSNISMGQADARFNFLMRFQNTAFQYVRMVVQANEAFKRGEISKAQMATIIAMYGVVQPVLWTLVGKAYDEIKDGLKRVLSGEEENELDKNTRKAHIFFDTINNTIGTFTGIIPVLGDLIQFAIKTGENKILEEMGLNKMNMYEMLDIPLISQLGQSAENIVKAIENENPASIIYNAAVLTSPLTMIPARTIVNLVDPVSPVILPEGQDLKTMIKPSGGKRKKSNVRGGSSRKRKTRRIKARRKRG